MWATMAVDVKDLCRLCAKKEHDLKDLNDENNKNILKIIQEFIQIAISENDTLPTKICLNCEEKMVSFQLFVLECYNVQETLQSMCLKECEKYSLKFERSNIQFGVSDIKSEVKDELDDVAVSLETEKTFSDFDGDYENDEDYKCDSDSDDGLTLASLKEAKLKDIVKKTVKHRQITEEERQEFESLLQMSKFKLKDFVKMKCEICSKSFKTWNALQFHYMNTHSSKAVAFCICGFAIKSKNAVYRHVASHKSERRKIQKSCEGYHIALKVSDFIKFNCEECKEEFSSWYKLNSHCSCKHKITPIVRCKCGIPLNSRTAMYKHIQDHRAPNVLHCNECPKIAKTVEELKKHKMRHIPKSERTFQCSSCDKQFSSKDCLKSHERSHIPIEQRKIYECDVCNEKFTTRSSAVSHKRIVHDKIKSYVCDLCGYACGTNGELRQHRAIHSEDKPYACRKCSKAFKTYSNLKTHMDTHEETSYVCFVCSRVLNSRRTLRKHLLVHEDKCTHVCNYCNKAFKRRQTLKVHLAMHTGDKPLTCRWCDERFAYASTLRSHRLRAHPDKIPAHFAGNYNAQAQQVPQNYLKNEAATLNVTTKCDVQQINN